MTAFNATRRRFLVGAGAVGAGALLSSCVTQSPSATGGKSGGPVTLQSNLSSPQAKTAMKAIVAAFDKRGDAQGAAQHRRLGDLPHPAADLPHLGQPAGRLHLVPRVGRRVVRQEGPAPRHQRHLGEAGARRLLRRAEEAVHLGLQRQEGLRAHQLLLVGHVLPEVQLRQVGRAGAQELGRVPRPVRQAQEQGRRPDRPRRRRRHPVGGLRMVRLPQHPRQRRDVPPRTPRGQAPLRRPRGPQGLRPLGRGAARTSTPTARRSPSRTPPPRCSRAVRA